MSSYVIDGRSREVLSTLHKDAAPWFEAFLVKANTSGILPEGIVAKAISGHRSWEEQNKLYAQGRTSPGKKVTNARGGYSNHNYGIAIDIGLFKGSTYLPESPYYAKLGAVGKSVGLSWGGDWKSIKDMPHYEVQVGMSLSAMRSAVMAGRGIPVPKYQAAVADEGKIVRIMASHDPANFALVRAPIVAILVNGSTWVNVEDFCDFFGGAPTNALLNWKVSLNGESITVPAMKFGSSLVKFSDLNKLYGLHPTFDSRGQEARLELR